FIARFGRLPGLAHHLQRESFNGKSSVYSRDNSDESIEDRFHSEIWTLASEDLRTLSGRHLNHPVVIFGEAHCDPLYRETLIASLPELGANGITILGLEFITHSQEPALNAYLSEPNAKLDDGVMDYLLALREVFGQGTQSSLLHVIDAAKS